MKSKFWSILILAGLIVFIPLVSVQAANNSRYLVKIKSQFWKNAFNARHDFNTGFTADLNEWQLRLARVFNIELEPVELLQISPEKVTPSPKNETLLDKTAAIGKGIAARLAPTSQLSWGVKMIYGDPLLEKTSGGTAVRVAILDTGILASHPDLKGALAGCKDFSNPKFSKVSDRCEDKNGHGTHVAGIIAANGGADGLGIYGVAPQAELLIFKVCANNGICYADDVAAALREAVVDKASIVNLSLGSNQASSLIAGVAKEAVERGVLVIAAAGNDGPYAESIDYPAAHQSILAVGALASDLTVADWSSRGINTKTKPNLVEEGDVELVAPGVNIESTWKDGGYAVLSGTSMAAPFVTGLAAKLLPTLPTSANPAVVMRAFLQRLALDVAPLGDDDASGFGFPRLFP